MKYHKLVRDKIPSIIKNKGEKLTFHIAPDKEYKEKLFNKLEEEIQEFFTDNSVDELADILEVIYAICDLQGISKEDLEKVRKEKLRVRGGFKRKIILDEA